MKYTYAFSKDFQSFPLTPVQKKIFLKYLRKNFGQKKKKNDSIIFDIQYTELFKNDVVMPTLLHNILSRQKILRFGKSVFI